MLNPNDLWIIGAFATLVAIVGAMTVRALQSGQLVGSMPCKLSRLMGGTRKGRLKVYREGFEPGGVQTVQLILRAGKAAEHCGYMPPEALALADFLDEAARKAGSP